MRHFCDFLSGSNLNVFIFNDASNGEHVRKNSVIPLFQAVTDPVYRIMMAVFALEDTRENGHSQLAFVIVIWAKHFVIIRGACEFTFGDHVVLYLEIWTRNCYLVHVSALSSSLPSFYLSRRKGSTACSEAALTFFESERIRSFTWPEFSTDLPLYKMYSIVA